MITSFHVENFKALRDITLELTPVHVLIGPNGSGKTSILEALSGLIRSATIPLQTAFSTNAGTCLTWQKDPDLSVTFRVRFDSDQTYGLTVKFKGNLITEEEWYAAPPDFKRLSLGSSGSNATALFRSQHGKIGAGEEVAATIIRSLSSVQTYRWNPRLLALPAAPDSSRRFRMHESGFGLVLCLDDILGFDRNRFMSLEATYRSIFPEVRSIQLLSEPGFNANEQTPAIPSLSRAEGKGVHIEFTSGLRLPAMEVSDGMLLVLAYLSLLQNPEPPRVLLIEEPENGVHPQRLRDVLKILRQLVQSQSHTQIIFTTHSPYVVDLFDPNEVTLCNKKEDGSVVTQRLSESAIVEKQRKVFTLGEIWSAEGDDALTAMHSKAPKDAATE